MQRILSLNWGVGTFVNVAQISGNLEYTNRTPY